MATPMSLGLTKQKIMGKLVINLAFPRRSTRGQMLTPAPPSYATVCNAYNNAKKEILKKTDQGATIKCPSTVFLTLLLPLFMKLKGIMTSS